MPTIDEIEQIAHALEDLGYEVYANGASLVAAKLVDRVTIRLQALDPHDLVPLVIRVEAGLRRGVVDV